MWEVSNETGDVGKIEVDDEKMVWKEGETIKQETGKERKWNERKGIIRIGEERVLLYEISGKVSK